MLTLYHATPVDNLPSILRDGLDPSRMAQWEDEDSKYVFLDDRPWVARWWAKMLGVPCVILRVELPDRLAAQLVLDKGEFVRCPVTIPPVHIEEVSHAPAQETPPSSARRP